MRNYFLPSLKLTLVLILLCAVVYPLLVAGIGKLSPGHGGGEKISVNGKVVGYAAIGQRFRSDRYFWGRPSAVDYNAAGSGGSNKSASDPAYLQTVQSRIDSFLAHHPGVTKEQVPAEMVTASGSGLDPDISPNSAMIQLPRVAKQRNLPVQRVKALVKQYLQTPLFGPPHINVLKLNIALDGVRP